MCGHWFSVVDAQHRLSNSGIFHYIFIVLYSLPSHPTSNNMQPALQYTCTKLFVMRGIEHSSDVLTK